MKQQVLSTVLALSLAPPLIGAHTVPSMQPRTPHDEAVEAYNRGERRLEKLTRMHEEMKGLSDQKRMDELRQEIADGLEAAAVDFQRAAEKDRDLYQAYSELGFVLRKLGRYSASIEAYNKALDLKPGFPPALEYRAEAMLGLQQFDEVKTAYLTLFGSDRSKADVLMASMKSWIAEQRSNPGAVEPQKLDAFSRWVEQRETIAGLTTSVMPASTFRSW